jgi:hypothetical protein
VLVLVLNRRHGRLMTRPFLEGAKINAGEEGNVAWL